MAEWLRVWRAACEPARPSDEAEVASCNPPKMATLDRLLCGARVVLLGARLARDDGVDRLAMRR